MPLQATSGAASYDAFGGGATASLPQYIEDVFSAYLYNGTGAAQTIANGINLSGKGGMVWTKKRNGPLSHIVFDTVRGADKAIYPDLSLAEDAGFSPDYFGPFNSTGYGLSLNATQNQLNQSAGTYVSWTYRKQPKFFDVVTYTGNSTANRTVAHSLGSVPGCIIVKDLLGGNWNVYHRSVGITKALALDVSDPAGTSPNYWDAVPTSSVFTVGTDSQVNFSGHTYVAYLFAHDAGGFGLLGTDNVISCGSYTGNGSATGPVVTLGYEPQWLIIKNSSNSGSWQIIDNMRGMRVGSADATLQANTADTETLVEYVSPTATGFQVTSTSSEVNTSSDVYVYIAIRRGPMKVPEIGTSVFKPNATSAAAGTVVTTNFPVDLEIGNFLDNSDDKPFTDRLRGYATSTSSRTGAPFLNSPYTNAETTSGAPFSYNWWNTSVIIGNYISEYRQVSYYFGRAPSFFDEVCYTGTEVSGQTFNHNLGAMPEMMIVKARSGTTDWTVYHSALGASARIYLNATNAANTGTAAPWNSTAPTSTVFSLGDAGATNLSGTTFVNYLFATCAGVSKVGSYTGTGTTLQINCGFTGGARFVLIKRTDSTGAWYVWDSARGIVAGNDPYLLLNTTAPEVTNTDYVDTYSAGFEISSTAPAAINASGGTFIFLAIA